MGSFFMPGGGFGQPWPPYPDNTGPFGGWDWGMPPANTGANYYDYPGDEPPATGGGGDASATTTDTRTPEEQKKDADAIDALPLPSWAKEALKVGRFMAPAIGAILSGVGDMKSDAARQQAAQLVMAQMMEAQGWGRAAATDMFGRAVDPMTSMINQGQTFAWGNQNQPGLIPQTAQGLQGYMQGLPGAFGNQNIDPGMGDVMTRMLGNQGYYAGSRDVAGELMGLRGQTQDTRGLFDQANRMAQGQGAAMSTMPEWAFNVGNAAFTNPLTSGLQGNVPEVGWGYSPLSQAASQEALGVLTNQGMTPAAQALLQSGQGMVGGPAVPPLDLMISTARDVAGQQSKAAARSAFSRAQARGGPAAIGAGSREEAYAEFEDEIARNQTQAIQNAINQWMTARQQEQATGVGALGAAGSTQTGMFGEAARALPQFEQAATSRYGTTAQAGLDARQQSTSEMALALQTLGAYNQLQQGALGQGLDVLGLEADRYNMGTQNYLASLSGQQNSLNQILAGNVAAQNLNLNRAGGFSNAMLPAYSQLSDIGFGSSQDALNAANIFTGMGSGLLNFAQGAFPGIQQAGMQNYPGWNWAMFGGDVGSSVPPPGGGR